MAQRPIIFKVGRLSGRAFPALLMGVPAEDAIGGPTSRLLNNGPAEYSLFAMAGLSFLLSTTPAPDPQWQPNAAEHQGRTHELALTQSQQFSGLLRAQTLTVAAAANQPRILVVQPQTLDSYASKLLLTPAPTAAAAAINTPRVLIAQPYWQDSPDSFSWSQYLDFFDQPNLRPVIGNPERPNELLGNLLKAQAVGAAAAVGINPRVIVGTAADVATYASFTLQAYEPSPYVRVRTVDAYSVDVPPSYVIKIPQYFHAPVLRPVVGMPERPAEYPSALQRPHFEVSATLVGINPRVIVGMPERPQEFLPTRSAPRFEPIAQGIQPRILYGIPEQVSAYSSLKQPALFAALPTNATIRYAQPEQVAAFSSEYRNAQTPLPLIGINPRVITTQPWIDHTVPSFHVRPTVPLLDIFGTPFPTYTQFDSRTRIGGKVLPSVSARIGGLTGADSRTRIGPKVNRRKNR